MELKCQKAGVCRRRLLKEIKSLQHLHLVFSFGIYALLHCILFPRNTKYQEAEESELVLPGGSGRNSASLPSGFKRQSASLAHGPFLLCLQPLASTALFFAPDSLSPLLQEPLVVPRPLGKPPYPQIPPHKHKGPFSTESNNFTGSKDSKTDIFLLLLLNF